MAKIDFRGAAFQGFRFTPAPKRGEGGPMVVIDFSAKWTDKIQEKMGWAEVPDSVSGNVSLIPNDLAVDEIEMKPGRGMENHAFTLEATELAGFHLFIPTDEAKERELRFVVRTPAKGAAALLDKYGRGAGDASGVLTASVSEPKQEVLVPTEQTTIDENLKGEALEAHKAAKKAN